MSYTLQSKKRKLHRILDSLSKRPQTPGQLATSLKRSTSSVLEHTRTDLSAKRVRLSDGRSVRLAHPSSHVSEESEPICRPSFMPWDRERFLVRLETFRRVDRWPRKPAAINEVEWAKRGWICTDVARVSCVGECGGSVVVKLPDELDELDGYDIEKVQERKEVRAKLVEKYVKLLTEGHAETCPWKAKGCDATIHRVAVSNSDTALADLQKRYSNLVKMGDKLPSSGIIKAPGSLSLDEMINILPQEAFQDQKQYPEVTESTEDSGDNVQQLCKPELSVNRAAFALALFGWDVESDGAACLVGCAACFRRLGLWMYRPKEAGVAPVYDALEVASEHMEYCPWINRQSQSGTSKTTAQLQQLYSAWELVVQGIKANYRKRTRDVAPAEPSKDVTLATPADDPFTEDPDQESRKASDGEWWTKIRRMRQILHVKSLKQKVPSE